MAEKGADIMEKTVRNVVLVSHSGAGKTTLTESMLFCAGAITRLGKVADGNTTSDFEPEEARRGISISLSVLTFDWGQARINLLDAPGYADFMGEVKAGVRVADAGLLVVCAASGVEVGTEQVWEYLEEAALPRAIVINKMDRENADFFRTLDQLRSRFGPHCHPIHLPVGSQATFQGLVDLVAGKAILSGQEAEVPPEMAGAAASYKEKLVEAVAELDDALLTKYLDGAELTEGEMRSGLRAGVASGKVVPVLVASGLKNLGVSQLLDALASYLPSPGERGPAAATLPLNQEKVSLAPVEDAPLAALAFKTTADPYVGRLTYLRVFSGVLASDSSVQNAARGRAERIGQLYQVRGKGQEPVPRLAAGDIGAVAKLAETATGDTLCGRDRPLALEPIRFPTPVFSLAIQPKTKADLDKLMMALGRLCDEDSTLRVRKERDTGETVLSGLGEAHLDVAVERMRRKFGVEVITGVPRVPYRETITVSVKAEYKHKKQTGGHGQYGHVFLALEPLPRGEGVQFAEKVVGGAVPKNYIPAVEKGVMEGVQEGVLAGYPMVDIRVTLYDGSYHSVDSSEMSFKVAASHALRKGVSQAHPVLLEPIVIVRVTVPDSFTGETIGDLNGKRAKVLGMTPKDGHTVIEALAPLAEMLRYATAIRSITQGRGVYTLEFSHYEEVPPHTAQHIMAEAKKGEEKG